MVKALKIAALIIFVVIILSNAQRSQGSNMSLCKHPSGKACHRGFGTPECDAFCKEKMHAVKGGCYARSVSYACQCWSNDC
ncbi:hypothetical protein CJ030_MR0G005509 [Morella rubra]|uniref:Defensin-like protein 1 n=1 Tax=Morella rubra TaxID=262757 RepID=A0A6A1UKY4_9ROSI|nr:hypothetical protein CJ030_MR0G005509 [Morella rubra]